MYYVKNYYPDISKLPPVFPSGDYMFECMAFIKDELIQGFKLYGQLFNIQTQRFLKERLS